MEHGHFPYPALPLMGKFFFTIPDKHNDATTTEQSEVYCVLQKDKTLFARTYWIY